MDRRLQLGHGGIGVGVWVEQAPTRQSIYISAAQSEESGITSNVRL
jgi:hypothetical protein